MGRIDSAIGLFLWCALVVALPDNLLRPVLRYWWGHTSTALANTPRARSFLNRRLRLAKRIGHSILDLREAGAEFTWSG